MKGYRKVRIMSDELVNENSTGTVQSASIDVGASLSQLESAMKQLGIDRRSSMPQDVNSLEYRLRDAHANLQGAKNELEEGEFNE